MPPAFIDLAGLRLSHDTEPTKRENAIASLLETADWSAFDPALHLRPLRHALLLLERSSGVGVLHQNVTKILIERGARLVHAQGHISEVVALSVSPCGRYLATGSWVGDDYDRGGALQVWEVETGRAVQVLDPVDGGIGWPDYAGCLAWSADGNKLVAAYNTNSVGMFDPFGASPDALATADVTDGWSRPPSFCFLPDGKHVYVACWRESKVPGALVTFDVTPKKSSSKRRHELAVKAMAKEIPEAKREKLENGHLEPARSVIASADGARVYCVNPHGLAYAITLATGELDYVTRVGLPAVYSPDGRYLAHTLVGLVFYDGKTGLPTMNLPMHMGPSSLHWGTQGAVARLAAVVREDNDFGADPGVHLYDEGVYRYSIDAKPRALSWDDADFEGFAWAPSGDRAAVLTDEGEVWIFSLGDSVVKERALAVPEETRGVFWVKPSGSSEDVLVLAGRTTLRFVRASSGEIIADHTFMRAPPVTRPLDTGSSDLGDSLRPDPTFALDENEWAAAFPEGLVIAPLAGRDRLDTHLAWVIDRRYSWPARWGGLEIVASASDVATSAIKPARVNWRKFKKPKVKKQQATFPPAMDVKLGALFDATAAAMEGLSPGWYGHIGEKLLRASVLRARRGEIAEALALTGRIPVCIDELRAIIEVTAVAARLGRAAEAREAFDFAVDEVKTEMQEHDEFFVATSMFSAYTALGEKASAKKCLAKAKAKMLPEVNAWQNRLALLWALAENGADDEARALFNDKKAWQQEPSIFYSIPFVVAMARENHVALLFEFLTAWKRHNHGNFDWTLGDTLSLGLARFGHPTQLALFAAQFGLPSDDERMAMAKAREGKGPWSVSPSPADIEALASDYVALQKTPRARRAGLLRALVSKAAACGHIGAVVELIPQLPGKDFNDRATAAAEALWLAATGLTVLPW